MFTDAQITEFRRLYQKYFSREIGHQEAYEQGVKLVRLIELISRNYESIGTKIQKHHG